MILWVVLSGMMCEYLSDIRKDCFYSCVDFKSRELSVLKLNPVMHIIIVVTFSLQLRFNIEASVFWLSRVCTWCTTQSSSQTPTPWLSCCPASLGITSSAPPTTRKTCSDAPRAHAPSGAGSQHTSSACTTLLMVASTAASSWPRVSGEWRGTSTTLVTWWGHCPTALPVASATYSHTSTLFTWPSCWSTAVCVMSTAAAASMARTGNATQMLCLTG